MMSEMMSYNGNIHLKENKGLKITIFCKLLMANTPFDDAKQL